MAIQLRPYQIEDLERTRQIIKEKGIRRALGQQATGLGKTILQIKTIEELFPLESHKIIMMAPNQDLIYQHTLAIKRFYHNLMPTYPTQVDTHTYEERPSVGIVMNRHNEIGARMVVASVPTLIDREFEDLDKLVERRLSEQKIDINPAGLVTSDQVIVSDRFDQYLAVNGLPDVIFYDEAHAAVADGSLMMIQRLDELADIMGVSHPIVLGYTATPWRYDGRALSNVFDVMMFRRTFSWAQRNGWLVPFAQPERVSVTTEDDNEETSSIKAVSNWDEVIADAYAEKVSDRPTVAFVGSYNDQSAIDCSKKLAETLRNRGVKAAHVDGFGCVDEYGHSQNKNHRSVLYDKLGKKEIDIICNYNVMTQGIDIPEIGAIMLARRFGTNDNINSAALTQAIGRGLRLAPGKEDLKILDFTGQKVTMLELGTLAGYKVDVNSMLYGEELPAEQADQQELLAAEDLRELELDTQAQAENLIRGKDAVYNPMQIYRKSAGDWFIGGNTACQSLNVGENTVLVIQVPDMISAAKVLDYFEKEQPQGDKFKLASGVLDMFENFTLWEVDTSNIFKPRIKRQLGSEVSLETLVAHSTSVIETLDDVVDSFHKKGRKWKYQKPTQGQLNFIEKLAKRYQWTVETPERKGDAAKLISHFGCTVVDSLYKQTSENLQTLLYK